MKNLLEYKGYYAKVEYSVEDRVLYGKIEGIRDLVNFESESAAEIETEFQRAVDGYLELCHELGQDPDKAYSGTFNVRINPQLHRKMAMLALKNGETLNAAVEKAIQLYTEDSAAKRFAELWSEVPPAAYGTQKFGLASVGENYKQGRKVRGYA